MKRLLAAVLLACLLAGCTEQSPYIPTGGGFQDEGNTPSSQGQLQVQGDIRLSYNRDGSLHPYTATDLNNRSLLCLVYQGLFATNDAYEPTPILCRSYKISADMKEWTFYLENATFSDGQALTAQDVVASLRAADANGFYAGRFRHVKSIWAGNDGSVVISLNTPMSNLPLLLNIPIIKASQINAATPLGTGPYILEDTADGKQLRRQPAWWCNAAAPVNAPIIPLDHGVSQNQLWDLYKFSGLSMLVTDTYVDFRGDYELWESENGQFLYLSCNTKSPVFSNKAVRSALTHAIDRDALVKKHFRGFAHSTTLPASPAFPHYSTSLAEKYGYAPEKFTQAVTDAGMTGSAIVLLVNREDPLRLRAAQSIAEMLTACGLTVTIPEVTGEDYLNYLNWGEFDLFLGQTKLSPNMDLTAFFAEKGALNYGNLTDVAANAMSLEALADSGNYQSLHKLVMDDGRLCPILVRSDAVYGRRGLFPELSTARDHVFYYSLGKTMEDAKITD